MHLLYFKTKTKCKLKSERWWGLQSGSSELRRAAALLQVASLRCVRLENQRSNKNKQIKRTKMFYFVCWCLTEILTTQVDLLTRRWPSAVAACAITWPGLILLWSPTASSPPGADRLAGDGAGDCAVMGVWAGWKAWLLSGTSGLCAQTTLANNIPSTITQVF